MQEARSGLYASLRWMLVPVVKLCVRHGVHFGSLIELLKDTFVRVAITTINQEGSEPTRSRISALTGVHRKDVARLLADDGTPEPAPSLPARVVHQWQQHPRFSTKRGHPRVLSILGAKSEFADLCREVSSDLNPYTVLAELERLQLVERTASGLRLRSRVYAPRGDLNEGLRLLSADVVDLCSAVNENLESIPSVPNLHIKTEYDNIPSRYLPEIKQWILVQGSAFHQRVRSYLSELDRDTGPKELQTESGRIRVCVGSFGKVDTDGDGANSKLGVRGL